jgi:hypothetical protein
VADALKLGFGIGLILGPLAGLGAFLIAYEEYQHHYAARGPAIRASLEVGVVTFVVFLALSVIAGILTMEMVQ